MLQEYVNQELPDVQAGYRKGRGTRDQIANICWIIEKVREFQKNIYSFIDYAKAFVWITTNCGKFLKNGNTRPPYLPSVKSVWRLRSNRTGNEAVDWSKLRKEDIKAVYCHRVYLILSEYNMHNT